MKFKSEYLVATSVIIGALIILGTLTVVIGNFDFGVPQRTVSIYFESVSGVERNTGVRVAGAQVGRVRTIRVLNRNQQILSPDGKRYMVLVTASIDPSVELPEDTTATLRSDSLLSPKFVSLVPGKSEQLLTANTFIHGFVTPDITDLAGPVMTLVDEVKPALSQLSPMLTDARQMVADARPMMADARQAVAEMKPAIASLGSLADNLKTSLPALIQRLDGVLVTGGDVLNDINSRQSRAQIQGLMNNLRVMTDNLKVVSSNAKALTMTLAEKPWRVLWGGKVVQPPPESEVLDSNKVIPLTPGATYRASTPSKSDGNEFRVRKSN